MVDFDFQQAALNHKMEEEKATQKRKNIGKFIGCGLGTIALGALSAAAPYIIPATAPAMAATGSAAAGAATATAAAATKAGLAGVATHYGLTSAATAAKGASLAASTAAGVSPLASKLAAAMSGTKAAAGIAKVNGALGNVGAWLTKFKHFHGL